MQRDRRRLLVAAAAVLVRRQGMRLSLPAAAGQCAARRYILSSGAAQPLRLAAPDRRFLVVGLSPKWP